LFNAQIDAGIQSKRRKQKIKLKVIIHEAAEGGYWAEVPAIPGCVSQSEDMEGLLSYVQEAIEACLHIEI